MTRFRRTALVLFLPLLVPGVYLAHYVFPYERYYAELCFRKYPSGVWCEDTGPYENPRRHDALRNGQPWLNYGVVDPNNRQPFINVSIEIEGGELYGVTVLGTAYDRRPDLTGKTLTLQVAYPPGQGSVGPDTDDLLHCQGVAYWLARNEYVTPCTRGVAVVFQPSDADAEMFEKARESAAAYWHNRRIGYVAHLAMIYPAFFGLFLAASAVVWLMRQAIRYVMQPAT